MPEIDIPQLTALLTALAPFAWIGFHIWRERRRSLARRRSNQT
jgi:hypothetical protein